MESPDRSRRIHETDFSSRCVRGGGTGCVRGGDPERMRLIRGDVGGCFQRKGGKGDRRLPRPGLAPFRGDHRRPERLSGNDRRLHLEPDQELDRGDGHRRRGRAREGRPEAEGKFVPAGDLRRQRTAETPVAGAIRQVRRRREPRRHDPHGDPRQLVDLRPERGGCPRPARQNRAGQREGRPHQPQRQRLRPGAAADLPGPRRILGGAELRRRGAAVQGGIHRRLHLPRHRRVGIQGRLRPGNREGEPRPADRVPAVHQRIQRRRFPVGAGAAGRRRQDGHLFGLRGRHRQLRRHHRARKQLLPVVGGAGQPDDRGRLGPQLRLRPQTRGRAAGAGRRATPRRRRPGTASERRSAAWGWPTTG